MKETSIASSCKKKKNDEKRKADQQQDIFKSKVGNDFSRLNPSGVACKTLGRRKKKLKLSFFVSIFVFDLFTSLYFFHECGDRELSILYRQLEHSTARGPWSPRARIMAISRLDCYWVTSSCLGGTWWVAGGGMICNDDLVIRLGRNWIYCWAKCHFVTNQLRIPALLLVLRNVFGSSP